MSADWVYWSSSKKFLAGLPVSLPIFAFTRDILSVQTIPNGGTVLDFEVIYLSSNLPFSTRYRMLFFSFPNENTQRVKTLPDLQPSIFRASGGSAFNLLQIEIEPKSGRCVAEAHTDVEKAHRASRNFIACVAVSVGSARQLKQ